MLKQKVWSNIDENSQMLKKMARDIWENPETDSGLVEKVKDEFRETTKNLNYKMNIGADAVPKKVKL